MKKISFLTKIFSASHPSRPLSNPSLVGNGYSTRRKKVHHHHIFLSIISPIYRNIYLFCNVDSDTSTVTKHIRGDSENKFFKNCYW